MNTRFLVSNQALRIRAFSLSIVLGHAGFVIAQNSADDSQTLPAITHVIANKNMFGLQFHGDNGKSYDIEYSENLKDWQVIMSGISGDVMFEDSNLDRLLKPSGYYRCVLNLARPFYFLPISKMGRLGGRRQIYLEVKPYGNWALPMLRA